MKLADLSDFQNLDKEIRVRFLQEYKAHYYIYQTFVSLLVPDSQHQVQQVIIIRNLMGIRRELYSRME